MTERAPATSVEHSRSSEPGAIRGDVTPLVQRVAKGSGPSPAQSAGPPVPSAIPIQMFADSVSAGLHSRVVQLDGTGGGLSADDVHRAAAHGFSGGGGALPHRSAIERSFGRHDVSGVRAHVGGAAAEGAAAMGAHAYASGDQIAFASSPDLHLAAHEAAHVVQQRGGVHLSSGVGAAGDAYEQHADAVADLVTRGESAEALLDQYAPAGAASASVQRAVQCWGVWDGTRPVALEGQPSAPVVAIAPAWLAGHGVPRGHEARISRTSNPVVFRAVVDALVEGYPGVDRERLASGLAFDITAAMWNSTPIRFRPTSEILSLLVLSDAPSGATVQVMHGEDGALHVLWDTERAYPPAPTDVDRLALATQIVEAVEAEIQHAMLAGARAGYLSELVRALPTSRGPASIARFPPHLLDQLFGAAVMATVRARDGVTDEVVPTGEGDRSIPGTDAGADREAIRSILVNILGRAPEHAPDAPPPAGATPLSSEELAQLSWLAAQPDPERQQILAVLREMRSGSHEGAGSIPRSADLASGIMIARNEAERRSAASALHVTLLDGANSPIDIGRLTGGDTGAPPAFPRPIRGEIRQPTVINVGNATSFTFDHMGRDIMPGAANPRITIQWIVYGPSGLPSRTCGPAEAPDVEIANEDMEYLDVPSEESHPFAATMTTTGHFSIHAFVSHDWYYPAHFTDTFEVVETSVRLDHMIEDGADSFGVADPDTERPHEFDVAGSGSDRAGTIREGELFGDVASEETWATGIDEETRLGEEITRLDRVRGVYTTSDPDTVARIDERLARLRAMQNRVHALGAMRSIQHAETQAHYSSSGEHGRSSDMNLVVTFSMEGPSDARRFLGELWDNTEMLPGEPAHLTVEAYGFHAMMEELFNGLSAAYPSGEMAFSYQVWEHEQPTAHFRELRRVTNTYDTVLDEVVFSPGVSIAVNIGAALLALFPPTAGIGIAIATTYNALQTEHDLEREVLTDRVRPGRQMVNCAQLLLDIIPAVGAATRTVELSGRIARVMEVAGAAGDAYVFYDDYTSQLQQLHDGDVSELAQAYADLEEARANAASDHLEELEQNVERLRLRVEHRSTQVFLEMAEQQALMRLSMHAIHRAADHMRAGAEDPHARVEEEGAEGRRGAPDEEGEASAHARTGAADESTTHLHEEEGAAPTGSTPPTHVTASPAHGALTPADILHIQREFGAIPVVTEEGWTTEVAIETVRTDDGIHVTHIRVGTHAHLGDVLGHHQTVAVIERYNGVLGQVYRLFDEMRGYLARRGLPGGSLAHNPFADHYGTVAWDAWHEVEKLERIIPEREAAIRDGRVTGEAADALRRGTEFLRSELDRHREDVRTAIYTGEGLVAGSGTGSIRTREQTTSDALGAGYPAPSTCEGGGINDNHYWYIRAPEGSGYEYQLVRRSDAPSSAPVLRLRREGGTLSIARELSALDTFEPTPRAAYDRLAAHTTEGRVVALRGVAPTDLLLGSMAGFETRLRGFCEEALRRNHPDWAQARIRTEARRIAGEVAEHQITVVRGTDELRAFDYAGAHRDEHGEASGDLHHLIPLYLGGDHTRLLDMHPDIHDRLHRWIDGLQLGGITLQPSRAHRASSLTFAEGAAVLYPDGTLQLYRFDEPSGNMIEVGVPRIPLASRGAPP